MLTFPSVCAGFFFFFFFFFFLCAHFFVNSCLWCVCVCVCVWWGDQGDVKVLCCTDLLARGIDLDVDLVMQADFAQVRVQ